MPRSRSRRSWSTGFPPGCFPLAREHFDRGTLLLRGESHKRMRCVDNLQQRRRAFVNTTQIGRRSGQFVVASDASTAGVSLVERRMLLQLRDHLIAVPETMEIVSNIGRELVRQRRSACSSARDDRRQRARRVGRSVISLAAEPILLGCFHCRFLPPCDPRPTSSSLYPCASSHFAPCRSVLALLLQLFCGERPSFRSAGRPLVSPCD